MLMIWSHGIWLPEHGWVFFTFLVLGLNATIPNAQLSRWGEDAYLEGAIAGPSSPAGPTCGDTSGP